MYTVNYHPLTGLPDSIQHDKQSIPIDPQNSDFQEFLVWNAQQPSPLDYQTGIGAYVPSPAEIAKEARKANAKAEAALATQLKTVTPTQAVAYIEQNVTDLPSAKAALKVMVRMIIALRDAIMPDLPDL